MKTEIPTIKLNGFPNGMSNVNHAHSIPEGFCRDADNVDFDDAGTMSLRPGSVAAVYQGGAVDSLWTDGEVAYFRDGSRLMQLNANYSSAEIASGLEASRPITFLKHGGSIWWSNGIQSGKIKNGVNEPWGVERSFNSLLSLNLLSWGTLFAGTYQVAVTYATESGEEGGCGVGVTIEVPTDGGGIALSNIPQPSKAAFINVYCTSHNGSELYLHGTYPAGTTQAIVTDMATDIALQTQHCNPMPPGTLMAGLGACIYVAAGKYVFRSRPLRYGQCKRLTDYWSFPDEVRVLAAVPDGIYIVTDTTTEFRTMPDENGLSQRQVVLPYGAPAMQPVSIPDTTGNPAAQKRVAWFSHHGWVIAGPSGQIIVPSEATVAVPSYESGYGFLLEQGGMRRLVATFKEAQ